MIAAMAVAAGAAFADTPITSANTVGYFNKTAQDKGTFMIAAGSFDAVTGEDADMNELVSCSLAINSYDPSGTVFQDGWFDKAAQIQIPNGVGGYLTYFYCGDAYVSDDDIRVGWSDTEGGYIEKEIPAGTAFWLKSPADENAEFTIKGAIAADSAITVSTSMKGANLAASGFPIAFDMNDTDVATWTGKSVCSYDPTGSIFQEGWFNEAVQLQIPNGVGGYLTYFYCGDAYVSDDDIRVAWADTEGGFINQTINVGDGFWLITPDNDKFSVTVKNPTK